MRRYLNEPMGRSIRIFQRRKLDHGEFRVILLETAYDLVASGAGGSADPNTPMIPGQRLLYCVARSLER